MPASEQERSSGETFSQAIAFALFAVAVALLLTLHEPWRDEVDTWALGAASPDVASFLHGIAYDPNPPLWFALLFAASRITASLWMLKAINFATALFCAGVIVTTRQLRPAERFALLGSYYILYEYGAISRPYELVAACIFLVARFAAERRAIVAGASAFALSALSTLYAVVAGLPFAAALLISRATKERRRFEIAAMSIAALALGLAGFHALTMPADFHFGESNPLPLARRIVAAVAAVTYGLLPLPRIALHFWNSSMIPLTAAALLAIPLLAAAALALRASRRALLTWAAATLLLIGFGLINAGSARHHGFFFVVFVGGLIVARGDHEGSGRLLLPLLLVVQCAGSLIAFSAEATQPFSQMENAAAYIEQHVPQSALVIGLPDTVAAPIAFLASRDIFLANGARYGKYVLWDEARRRLDVARVQSEIATARAQGRPVFLVTNRRLSIAGFNLRQVARFWPSVVADESILVYEVLPR